MLIFTAVLRLLWEVGWAIYVGKLAHHPGIASGVSISELPFLSAASLVLLHPSLWTSERDRSSSRQIKVLFSSKRKSHSSSSLL